MYFYLIMIGICSRCKKEVHYDHVTKKLCRNCVVSMADHKKRIEGKISETQRIQQNKRTKEWYQKNREKKKRYMKKYYEKYKKKWNSRTTNRLIRGKIQNYYNNKCTKCDSKMNLELHHLKYDIKNSEILKDIPKFIILLCRICHGKLNRLENISND